MSVNDFIEICMTFISLVLLIGATLNSKEVKKTFDTLSTHTFTSHHSVGYLV